MVSVNPMSVPITVEEAVAALPHPLREKSLIESPVPVIVMRLSGTLFKLWLMATCRSDLKAADWQIRRLPRSMSSQ